MTYKTTLSFTDRHHLFIKEKVNEGTYASHSAAVAAAVEQMMRDEEERAVVLQAMAEEIRNRMKTPVTEYIDYEEAFAAAREHLNANSNE